MSPTYDWRCLAGHEHEAFEDRLVFERECPLCLRSAHRQLSVAAGITGMVSTPTRYAPINLSQFVEAQHTLVYEAEKRHIDIPDPMKVARERIRRGDVKAIT